ncbi:MAG: 1-deoxy-D-xylulose-5-phosphate reductoisomerase [Proteobacteria bacterium]|nr:1-deoxy-D-xylulose-5-phosphate reductoisomerase [Alphaproteobacteria bacterium]NCC02888.1 1-deoxy-D-xylulose-5-phosphate reductoisomerase [Pseudomonadota bacterium]
MSGVSCCCASNCEESQTKNGKRRVAILGSTGSVGTQTIDLIEREPENYHVVALTARRNVKLLAEQARKLRPDFVAIADESKLEELKEALAGLDIEIGAGADAVVEAAERDSDWVMAAIVGAAGLPSTIAAAKRGAKLAFANKETLVCAGPLMMELVAKHGCTLLPVDSEHNAIYQVFDAERRDGISRLIITASGGPFRSYSREQMAVVTPEQAGKHPVWNMGAKISIDSATLMNKTLEVIEAAYLFQMPSDKIDVLVHPQSVIHSMVEYKDGSTLAQLGSPDMRIPIGYCLAWPARMTTPAAKLDLAKISQLTFEVPDPVRFPALRLGREALAKGGTAPAIMNAANEVAVQAFLDEKIGFLDIEKVIDATLNAGLDGALTDLDVLAKTDKAARDVAQNKVTALVA